VSLQLVAERCTFEKEIFAMVTSIGSKVTDRRQAGSLLANKLQQYANSEALITGISRGGLVVAAAMAKALNLELEILPYQKISHPADSTKSIGSVSVDEIVIEGVLHDIPQDYISHQIALIRNGLRNELQRYHRVKPQSSFRYKTVIVVDDILRSGDTMLACLRTIRKQQPLKLIIAVPFISDEAAAMINVVADEVVFIRVDHEVRSAMDYYIEFPDVGEKEVTVLLQSRNELEIL
jgi:predicted phosphoribosyltransferase